jgi:hypothetical protein
MRHFKNITSISIFLLLILWQHTYAQQSETVTDTLTKVRVLHRVGVSIGPSFLYGDNTGEMQNLKFKILPSAGIDYNLRISSHFDLRTTISRQYISSGSIDGEQFIRRITRGDDPYKFTGNLIAFDITPVLHINPAKDGFHSNRLKVYLATGIGYFYSSRIDQKIIGQNGNSTTLVYNSSDHGFYLPVRMGIHTKFYEGDIGFEGAMLISPFQTMDGISNPYKKINADIACQFQVFYRFNISKL